MYGSVVSKSAGGSLNARMAVLADAHERDVDRRGAR
jgi:hypothetical protein